MTDDFLHDQTDNIFRDQRVNDIRDQRVKIIGETLLTSVFMILLPADCKDRR